MALPEVVAGNDSFLENGSHANYIFAWHANGTILPNWPVKYDRQITMSSFGFGAPALADLDQDGRADVIVTSDTTMGSPSALNAYKSDGSKVAGFPKPTLDTGASSTNTVAVADLDGDGQLEMAWIDHNAKVYVWDLSAPNTAVAPWPMFQHDERHTGASLPIPEVIAPAAAVTSPSDGAYVGANVNVIAEATDNVGVVNIELYKDNVLVGSSSASPYTFAWDTTSDTEGPHTFISKAYDAAGNVGTSSAIVLNVDKTAPTTNVTAPANGAIVQGVAVAISATASDSSGVQKVDFYYDSNTLVGTDTTAPFTINWDTSTVDERHAQFACRGDRHGGKQQPFSAHLRDCG